ncbi:MAG: hypothetical protein Q8908_12400 [Bacteroidota bacterium]|nr:hypothetical protein [Bacteroidota bacterium]
MKKKFTILMLISVLSCLAVKAQIKEGTWFVNGLNVASVQFGSYLSDGSYGGRTNFTSVAIGPFPSLIQLSNSPTLSYGINSKWSGGLFLDLSTMHEKENNYDYSMSTILLGPAVRYYLVGQRQSSPYLEGRLGFGGSKSGSNASDKSNLFGYELGIGDTYFCTPHFGFDFGMGYEHLAEKPKDSSDKTTYGFFYIGVGVLVVF